MNRAPLMASALATLLAAGSTSALAGEVYAGVGLPGVMLGYAQALDERFTLRGDWATLGQRHLRTTESGVDYDATIGFDRAGLFGDWFVSTGGGFRLTAGVTFNHLKAELAARGDGVTQFNIGGTVFTSDVADRLDVKITYPKVTPYLGIGYGHQGGSGWGFVFDLGASYGKAEVSETHSGPNLGNPAVVTQADIDREMAELRDGAGKIRFIPQLSVGLNYRF